MIVAYLQYSAYACQARAKQSAKLCREVANTWQLPSSKLQQPAKISSVVSSSNACHKLVGQLAHVCCLRHRLTQAFALKVTSHLFLCPSDA